MEEPPWKRLKLSLERPYKDDNGEHIPALLDITHDGQHIYEPKDDPSHALGEKLRRIFVERGADFFDKLEEHGVQKSFLNRLEDSGNDTGHRSEDEGRNQDASSRTMSPEELYRMRMEIQPQLFVALGEMSHARELLSLLLSSPPSSSGSLAAGTSNLTATMVSKPPPIPSVQAFNSQLAIGGKDEALRKAASVFKSAADSMERGRIRGERYWVDALKIRRGNWGLIPAPLPWGAATGKGADKTSKDFLVSFGLEESSSHFKRRAIGHMASYDTDSDSLIFPYRQRTRLRVSISSLGQIESNSWGDTPFVKDDTLQGSLQAAQKEVVEQEIFSLLVKEAGNLPTASARVSERLIVIDAAQGMELKFELVNSENNELESRRPDTLTAAKCDFIYHALHALLLRIHSYMKVQRLGVAGIIRSVLPNHNRLSPPLLLQPIIDFLQYQVFCDRVKVEIDRMLKALSIARIRSSHRFNPVGQTGQELVDLFSSENDHKKIGGEAILRIDDRHTLRFTFLSPSTLTAHLPQATLAIASIPQLSQLLCDEMERCLLNRICELGSDLCESVNGTWFVDLVKSRSVGRWEGCVLNFCVFYEADLSIQCSAFRLDRESSQDGKLMQSYISDNGGLMSWVEHIIKRAISES